MSRRLILASASQARLRVLRGAGLEPEVIVSNVDEDGVGHLPAGEAVLALARRKAEAVAAGLDRPDAALVVGCDSMLEMGGEVHGKPATAAEAVERWKAMRGQCGTLHTGHCVLDVSSGAEAARTDSAVVRFGNPSDREIEAYVATGEPLGVAGAFTLEGLAAPWIDSIDGNHGTILGISVPVLRGLLGELGVELIDLWS